MSRSTRATKKRDVMLALERCEVALRRRKIRLGPLIDCGKQGCVFRSKRGTVVKVSTAGDWAKRRSSETQHDDFRGAAWLFAMQYRYRYRPGMIPRTLPTYKEIGTMRDCLKGHRKGPRAAYITWREDLRDLPPAVRRAIKPALYWTEELEEHMYAGGLPSTFVAKNGDKIRAQLSRNPIAWRLWTEILALQRWLFQRGGMLWDLMEDNLGIRGRGQFVVRDTGGVIALPTHRTPKSWSRHRLEDEWAVQLAGYDSGA